MDIKQDNIIISVTDTGIGSEFIVKVPNKKLAIDDKQLSNDNDYLNKVEIEFADIYE